MPLDQEIRLTIGEIVFGASEVTGLRTQSRINGVPTAEFTLESDSEKVRRVALTDRVVASVGGHGLFWGDVVEAFAEGDRLRVRCSTAPQFASDLVAFACRASMPQSMRMIALDSGLQLPETDEDNLVCKATSRGVDWDLLFERAEGAANCDDALQAIKEVTTDVDLSAPEREIFQRGLARIQRTIKEAGHGKTPVDAIPPSAYRRGIAEWRADAWRYRRVLDSHEVIAPIRNLLVPMSTVTIDGVTFMDASSTSVMTQYLTDDVGPFIRDEWELPAVARTVVLASDLWSARQLGRDKMLEALGIVAFRLNYSPATWKLEDARHEAPRFARPSGSCPRLADNSLVHNLTTDEYWLGPTGRGRSPDLVELRARGGPLLEKLGVLASEDPATDLSAHIRAALHWSYRAAASESLVDRFLLRWIALEMLLNAEGEDVSDVIRRMPFAVVSVGGKVKPMRRELERAWIPLRNRIVHRALYEDPRLVAGASRIQYFTDATIAHAIARANQDQTFAEWLAYLDAQAYSRPPSSEARPYVAKRRPAT